MNEIFNCEINTLLDRFFDAPEVKPKKEVEEKPKEEVRTLPKRYIFLKIGARGVRNLGI